MTTPSSPLTNPTKSPEAVQLCSCDHDCGDRRSICDSTAARRVVELEIAFDMLERSIPAHDASLDVVGLLVDGGFIAPDLEAKARAALGRDASLDVVPSVNRKDVEWLVDKAIHNSDITVSRGAEILGISVDEMRSLGRSLLTSSQPAAPTEAE